MKDKSKQLLDDLMKKFIQLENTEKELQAANQQLDASNQQLKASEQQLKAAIQQLTASEQQLRAANQQLKASNIEIRKKETEAVAAKEFAENIISTLREPLLILDADLKVITANESFYKTFHVSKKDTLGSFVFELGNNQWDIPALRKLLLETLPDKSEIVDFEVEHFFDDIGQKTMLLNSRELKQQDGNKKMILLAIEDITERKIAEKKVRAANQQLDASNQQLRASEQQLKAANQQLTANNQQLIASENEIKKYAHDLGERNKELNCLYSISKIVEIPDISLDEIVQRIVNIIPSAWQYPENICAKIILLKKEFKTENYKESTWKLSSDIIVKRKIAGKIEVCYLEQITDNDEGPFLKAEEILLNSITERLGRIVERKLAEDKIKHINRVLRAIRNVNQLITKENDRDKLIKGACDNLIETRGYFNAWIALLDGSAKYITSAESGLGKDFLPLLELLKKGKLTACGKKSLKQRGIVVTEVLFETCGDCPLADKYAGRGALSIRLEFEGKIFGIFCVSIPLQFIKQKEEQYLFNEVATDIAFALHRLEDEEKRKQVEKSLQESEERFRQIADNSQEWIWEVDANGLYTYASPIVKKILGYEPEEIVGKKHFYDLFYPEDRKKMKDAAFEVFAKKLSFREFSNRNISKTGKEIWLLTSGVPMLDEKGELLGYRGADIDITERKKIEEEIKEKSLELKKQFEKSEKQRIATLSVLSDLNETTRNLKAEIKERKQAEKIQEILYNISKAVNTTDKMPELYNKIKAFLGEIIDTTNFFVALYNENKDTISLPYFIDEKDDHEIFPAGKSLTKYVIKKGKPFLGTKDIISDLTEKGVVEEIGYPSLIWLGVPLKVENKVIGVIAVQSYDDPNLYAEKDIEILSFVSDEIALAINKKRTEEQIRKDLKEKTILLQEVHHRVKNNMQIISSLLNMQSKLIENEKVRELLDSSKHRIYSMSLVHEYVYKTEDMANIDFNTFTKNLILRLRSYYVKNTEQVKIINDIKVDSLDLNLSIPCGLIINELISNSLRHAFPGDRKGEIYIFFNRLGDKYTLIIKDNGIGIPETADFENMTGLGMQLIKILTSQLRGTVELKQDKGTEFVIKFKEIQLGTYGRF